MDNYNEKLQEVREVFRGDKFATENGMVIDEIGNHYAKCSVELTEIHRNAMGGVMGGVHFTLGILPLLLLQTGNIWVRLLLALMLHLSE